MLTQNKYLDTERSFNKDLKDLNVNVHEAHYLPIYFDAMMAISCDYMMDEVRTKVYSENANT